MLKKFFPLFRVTIKENSMKPFLKDGDTIIVMKYFFSKPNVGDVIIFEHPTLPFTFIKRIKKILKNKIWVEGDNKKTSVDSRNFGYINKSEIIGRMIFKK